MRALVSGLANPRPSLLPLPLGTESWCEGLWEHHMKNLLSLVYMNTRSFYCAGDGEPDQLK